jgi:uncharacterized protein (DUF1697 family)
MEKYIAFLRGINVGGKSSVKMTELKKLFSDMEFENVKTYINSGNVIFETNIIDVKYLKNIIEPELEKTFGFKTHCILRTFHELIQIIQNVPFGNRLADPETDSMYVTLLDEKPDIDAINELNTYKNGEEDFYIINCEVYLLCHKGYHDAKFNNNFLESKLRISATTRSWKTLNRLIEIWPKETMLNL